MSAVRVDVDGWTGCELDEDGYEGEPEDYGDEGAAGGGGWDLDGVLGDAMGLVAGRLSGARI